MYFYTKKTFSKAMIYLVILISLCVSVSDIADVVYYTSRAKSKLFYKWKNVLKIVLVPQWPLHSHTIFVVF